MANNIVSLFFFLSHSVPSYFRPLFLVLSKEQEMVEDHIHPGLSFLHIFAQQCITLILTIEQTTKACLREILKNANATGTYVV